MFNSDIDLKLQEVLFDLKEYGGEGLIVPIYGPRPAAAVLELLRGVEAFTAATPEQNLPAGVVGVLDFGENRTYSVFLPEVAAPRFVLEHAVLVAVKGTVEEGCDCEGTRYELALDWLIFWLKARAGRSVRAGLRPVPEFTSAWQFVRSPQFLEALRLYGFGRSYFITKNAEGPGLVFQY